MDQLTELGLPDTQAAAIRRLVAGYNKQVNRCAILTGCLDLSDGWVLVVLPVGDGDGLEAGVSPDGAVSM